MKNAQLIIKDGKGLAADIWDTPEDCKDWTVNTWKTAVKVLTEAMENIYKDIDAGSEVADWDLYSLGDAINLLNALEITME